MNIRSLKNTARERLSAAAYSPGRLALIYVGAMVALSLLTSLVDFLLSLQMGATSGLSGIGTRSMLSSAQLLLSFAGTALVPFWSAGFMRAALCIGREQPAQPTTLLEGFRRFGVVLRLNLLRSIFIMMIAFFCMEAASMIFMMLPLSANYMNEAMVLIETGAAIDTATATRLLKHMLPMFGIWIVLLCVVLIPLLYRFQLADWAVMDNIPRAIPAFGLSGICTRGHRFFLFRLDLSFWWYYGLQALASMLVYGDLFLEIFGVSINPTLSLVVFSVLSLGLQMLVAWRFAPQVQTTYALAYDELLNRSGFAKVQSEPQNFG